MQIKGTRPYPIAEDDTSQTLRYLFGSRLGLTEVEVLVVVVKGEDGADLCVFFRLRGRERIHCQGHSVVDLVVGGCYAGEVEGVHSGEEHQSQ